MSAVRKLFEGKIKRVIAEYSESEAITHAGTIGSLREEYLSKLLKEVLPTEVKIGSGFMCSPDQEKLSPQIDIIATQKNSGFSFPLNDSIAIHPFENILGIFEIKSTLKTDHFTQLKRIWEFISTIEKKYFKRTFVAEDISNISNFVDPDESINIHARNNDFASPPLFILTFDDQVGEDTLKKWFNELPCLAGIWVLNKKSEVTQIRIRHATKGEIEVITDLNNIEGSIRIIENMYEIFYKILLQNQYYAVNYSSYFK